MPQIILLHYQLHRLQFDHHRQIDKKYVTNKQSKTTEIVEVNVVKYTTQYI